MSKNREAGEFTVQGKKLVCPFCSHNRFYTRRTLLNTVGMTFIGLDWANKEATNFICEHCGHILWFKI